MDFRTDEEKQKEQKLKLAVEDNNYLAELNELLKLDAGKSFFKKLIAEGRVFNASFVGNSSVYYKEGKRALVLDYVRDLARANPKVLTEIFLEVIDEEDTDDRKRN